MGMSIAVLGTRGVPALYGGFETFAENLGIGLVSNDVTVTVYCPKFQQYKEDEYRGVRLRFISNHEIAFKNRYIRAACNLVYDIACLIDVAFRKEIEVVYLLGYTAAPFLFVTKLRGKKIVVNPDGHEWQSGRWGSLVRRWLYACERTISRQADAIVCDAKEIQRYFLDCYGVETDCIPYGADVYYASDFPCRPSEFGGCSYYLAVARLVPETNIPLLIDGFLSSGTDARLAIVGPIVDEGYFEAMIKPRLGDNRVVYLGPIYDKPRLFELRVYARALLHGHASEGTNPSLLESMGCGSPVLYFNRKSNFDVVRDNTYAFSGVEELSGLIRRLDGMTEAERAGIGSANREIIVQDYSWRHSVSEHLGVFGRVCR